MQNFDRNTNRHFCSTKIVLLPKMLKIYVDLPTFAQNKIFFFKNDFCYCLFLDAKQDNITSLIMCMGAAIWK